MSNARGVIGAVALTAAVAAPGAVALADRPAARFERPAALHRAAIPDGERWICAAETDVEPRSATCEREKTQCQFADRGGERCTEQDTAWIATAQDRKSHHWTWVAAPTDALCAARVKRELARFASVSACEQIGKTDPVPPDPALVPRGKGWYCYRDHGTRLGLGPPGSSAHCTRTERQCRRDHWGITDDNIAVLTTLDDSGCVATAKAFVFTTNDDYRAAPTVADCELERQTSASHTACAELH
jgi:hypothetical protein